MVLKSDRILFVREPAHFCPSIYFILIVKIGGSVKKKASGPAGGRAQKNRPHAADGFGLGSRNGGYGAAGVILKILAPPRPWGLELTPLLPELESCSQHLKV